MIKLNRQALDGQISNLSSQMVELVSCQVVWIDKLLSLRYAN